MSALEQKWRETGSTEDEAAWLSERLRSGDLKKERLELAALLGHEAACRASPNPPTVPKDAEGWVNEVLKWGQPSEFQVRVGTAAARCVLPHYDAAHPGDQRAREALTSIEEWLACPCDRHREAAEAPCSAAKQAYYDSLHQGQDNRAGMAISSLAQCMLSHKSLGYARKAVRLSSECTKWTRIHRAILDEVVPWCLGYDAPLAGRGKG